MKRLLVAVTVVVVVYLALIFFALSIKLAYGHEGEQWIADKSLRDPVSQTFCCGPRDCRQLDDDQIETVRGGYRVGNQYGPPEFVPQERAMPFSPDGHYHVCFTSPPARNHVRCLITPPPQSW